MISKSQGKKEVKLEQLQQLDLKFDNNVNKEICDIKKLSRYLNISVSGIRNLVREKRIPFFKIGNRLKFDLKKVNLWIDEKQDVESKQSIFY